MAVAMKRKGPMQPDPSFERKQKMDKEYILGGCVVSSTQYASLVSATTSSPHFTTRCLSVRSHNGGLGNLCTFSLAFGFVDVDIDASGLAPVAG